MFATLIHRLFYFAFLRPRCLRKHRRSPVRKWRRIVPLGCSLLLVCVGGAWAPAAARARLASPLKFEIKVVDANTGKSKSRYFLGETVSVVFTLTNQSRRVRTLTELQDTSIPVKLFALHEDEDKPHVLEGWRGGTGGSYVDPDGTVYWTTREPGKMTLAPGQSVSVRIDDLGRFFAQRLQDGSHTLTAVYNYSLRSRVSFLIEIDEGKSVPALEKMAAAPLNQGDESDRIWANSYLRQIRQPSISGRITLPDGKPLNEATIYLTGSEKTNIATSFNGRYHLTQMIQDGTYTLTPSEPDYTFEPASRTVTNLNSKLIGVDFTATRVKAITNVAWDYEGGTVRASSALDDDGSRIDNVIDSIRSATLGGTPDIWSDATPGIYPDWVEIKFKRVETIDWINVFTLKDNYKNTPEPTMNETFSKFGITDFDVQYWSGRLWKNVPGGAIRGNTKVWRQITFPSLTTNKIRVVVKKAVDGHSRIAEIEAFHVNVLPAVKISGRSKGRTGSKFQFRGEAVADGTVRRYSVGFGDNTPGDKLEFADKTARKQISRTHWHTFAQAGTYTVTLRVTDDRNDETEATTTITISDPPKPPTAHAGGPYEGIVGADVFLEGRASFDPDGRIVRYRWNFGDGRTGTGATPLHKYTVPGPYKVILMVTDDHGLRTRAQTLVRIKAASPKP